MVPQTESKSLSWLRQIGVPSADVSFLERVDSVGFSPANQAAEEQRVEQIQEHAFQRLLKVSMLPTVDAVPAM